MKTLRYRIGKEVKPGIVDTQGQVRDASSLVKDWDRENVTIDKLNEVKKADIGSLPIVQSYDSIAPCVCKESIGKFICIGLNYSDHAEETGMKVPPEPIIFAKATSAVIGPNDDVEIPKKSVKSDWEVELGVIIGKEAKYISEDQSQDHISGYCIVNDVSERSYQFDRGGQWIKGKSAPTFAPIGPFIVTADEIEDPQNLNMELSVNGITVQKSNTSDMIFKVTEIISHLSNFMALRQGDIIATGTPEGVGIGMKPPMFLKEGDIMELEIDFLGSQKQTVVAYK